MPEPKKTASFQTQGRLLQELGERLVAKADVALMELIKNAYDADASECRVEFEGACVKIRDAGHGMPEPLPTGRGSGDHVATNARSRAPRASAGALAGFLAAVCALRLLLMCLPEAKGEHCCLLPLTGGR